MYLVSIYVETSKLSSSIPLSQQLARSKGGPSGVGKGTLIASALRKFGPSKLGFAVSHTTRAPRPGEVDGEHYHFVSNDQFQELVNRVNAVIYMKRWRCSD